MIKVTLEIKDRKVYKAPLELMVLLDQPDLLDHKELTQQCLDLQDHKDHKETREHKDQREIKEILGIKGRKVYKASLVLLDQPDLLDPQELTQQCLDQLDHKEKQDHRDQREIKVTLEIKGRKEYKG